MRGPVHERQQPQTSIVSRHRPGTVASLSKSTARSRGSLRAGHCVSREATYHDICAIRVGELCKKIATLRHTPNNRVPNSKCQERRRQTPGQQRIHVRSPEIDNRQSSGNREGNLTKVEGNECAAGTSMAPGETALFQCQPALREGLYSQVVLGRPIHSAVMTEINTALSPIGIASADTVMSEGGPGEGSITCEVNLENIVRSRRQPPGLDTLGSPSGLEGNDGKQAIHGVLSPLSPTGETHGHSTQFHQ
jgi:hypothetical protein